MSSLTRLYRRWRHTRGFGVHSPFAFRLVTEVIRPPLGYIYYAEEEPDMPPPRRMAYRLDIFLRNETGSAAFTDLKAWLADPRLPLFVRNPRSEDVDAVENLMRAAGYGLLLKSRCYLIAVPRKEMAFVSYDIL